QIRAGACRVRRPRCRPGTGSAGVDRTVSAPGAAAELLGAVCAPVDRSRTHAAAPVARRAGGGAAREGLMALRFLLLHGTPLSPQVWEGVRAHLGADSVAPDLNEMVDNARPGCLQT